MAEDTSAFASALPRIFTWLALFHLPPRCHLNFLFSEAPPGSPLGSHSTIPLCPSLPSTALCVPLGLHWPPGRAFIYLWARLVPASLPGMPAP